MQIEQAIYARLAADATLSALVGTRIYPDQGQEDADLPFVVYDQAEEERVRTMTGYVSLGRQQMRLEVTAATKSSAKAVVAALKGSLDGYAGPVGSGTLSVAGIFHEGEASGAEPPYHANALGEYTAELTLSIFYSTSDVLVLEQGGVLLLES